MDRSELLERLIGARADLLAAVEGLSEAEMTTQPVAGSWPIRDILAHVGGWAAWDLAGIRGVLAGQPPDFAPIQNVDAFNAGLVAARSGWSPVQVLAEMRDVQTALLSLLAGLSDDDLFHNDAFRGPYWSDLAGWLQIAWEHEAEHAAQIRSWRATCNEKRGTL